MSDVQENLQSVINIAQTALRRLKGKVEITPALIQEKVEAALAYLAAEVDPGIAAQVNVQAAVDELVRRNSQWIGNDSTIKDNEGHQDWLKPARKKEWRYWQRYREWMNRKTSDAVVDALDVSTDHILGLLEDPLRAGGWDRRGLVVGHVQSGKTGNYSGLVCKAADAGYKLIIVLAGLHNNLRAQTQVRLEEAFLGYETSVMGDAVKRIGVGEVDDDPSLFPACFTNRSDKGDFNTRVANHLANRPEERPWLFVVKKNKTVLERLLKWIRNHVADTVDASGRRVVSSLPLLIIDDEADHASVDTGEQIRNADGSLDEDYQPKAINGLIRKIINSFSRSAYVGYTATPFANIFIHQQNALPEEGPDLFPRSFIINLAAPSNYMGPARVFGLRGPDGRKGGLPLKREFSDYVDATGAAGWMPPKHQKYHVPLFKGENTVPPSLAEAIAAFVLACAAKVCRGQGDEHSSMLIHVTRYTQVQKAVHQQVEDLVRRMRQRLVRGTDGGALVAYLKQLWEKDFEPTSATVLERIGDPAGVPITGWDEILEALPDVISEIELNVRMINGSAKDALDYVQHDGTGLKVIAIGGEKLARGLTLEGLCVSYFVRTTKMYDTLMQMGRWFGYRPGYADLCRLYTTSELVEWFEHIADASEELREEFDAMVNSGGTPRDYGLKVQSHPILTVTSPLKMRTAKTLLLSYSGSLVQTVKLHRNSDSNSELRKNLDATNQLLLAMGTPDERAPRREREGSPDEWRRSLLWKGVDANLIIDFLSSYSTHPDAYRANSSVLAEFVTRMVASGELTSWTVGLMCEGRPRNEPYTFAAGIQIAAMPSRGDTGVKGSYSIGVLTDPSDEAVELDYHAWKVALDQTREEWKPDPGRNRVKLPDRPSGKKLRDIRGLGAEGIPASPQKGLLLLYPLAPDDVLKGYEHPIMAFAISFPSSHSAVKVEYKVNHLLWEQEYGSAD